MLYFFNNKADFAGRLCIRLLLVLTVLFIDASVFDSIQWEKVYESNGISVYVQRDKNEKLNYYKAEKVINHNIAGQLYNNILDFDSYPDIFPRNMLMKKVKHVSEGRYIVYSLINFKPLKNRDYYINFEFFQNGREYIVEWSPVKEDDCRQDPVKKGVIRADNLYGRWHIADGGKSTKISVELHSDFKFDMPSSTLLPFEVTNTAQMLEDLISYTLKKQAIK